MLRKLRKEAQRESKLVKKKLQREQEQDAKGNMQKLREERSWASDEEEFKETLPRTDSGQTGSCLLLQSLHCFLSQPTPLILITIDAIVLLFCVYDCRLDCNGQW